MAIVVYVTKPCGKVIGEFSIEDIIMESPSELWNKTEKYAGIKRQYFNEYFKNREYGFAIKIKDFVPYKHPLSLEEYNPNIKVAPQSFCYIRE